MAGIDISNVQVQTEFILKLGPLGTTRCVTSGFQEVQFVHYSSDYFIVYWTFCRYFVYVIICLSNFHDKLASYMHSYIIRPRCVWFEFNKRLSASIIHFESVYRENKCRLVYCILKIVDRIISVFMNMFTRICKKKNNVRNVVEFLNWILSTQYPENVTYGSFLCNRNPSSQIFIV